MIEELVGKKDTLGRARETQGARSGQNKDSGSRMKERDSRNQIISALSLHGRVPGWLQSQEDAKGF